MNFLNEKSYEKNLTMENLAGELKVSGFKSGDKAISDSATLKAFLALSTDFSNPLQHGKS